MSAAGPGGLRCAAALIFYWLSPPEALSLLAASARWGGVEGEELKMELEVELEVVEVKMEVEMELEQQQ